MYFLLLLSFITKRAWHILIPPSSSFKKKKQGNFLEMQIPGPAASETRGVGVGWEVFEQGFQVILMHAQFENQSLDCACALSFSI